MTNKVFALTSFFVALAALAAQGAITSVNLSNYQLTATIALPAPAASEASAVTFNWDNGNLFIAGDEGDAIVEVTRAGVPVSNMTLTGFDDTEGLTYIGGGQFVIVEERLQDVYKLTYTAGGSVARASLQTASLGDTVGNIGLEGVSYEPSSNSFFVVKEKTPQQVRQATINFATSAATVNDVFVPSLGVLDLSDIQVLSTVPSLIGTADQDNLLIYSQESALLMEVTRSGSILSQFSFAAIAGDAEGVTIDDNGVIYVVGETPEMYVLTPIPEPSSVSLLLVGALGCTIFMWRRHVPRIG